VVFKILVPFNEENLCGEGWGGFVVEARYQGDQKENQGIFQMFHSC